MTFRLRHEYEPGARVNGSRLGSCMHCATLRVEDIATGAVSYVLRAVCKECEADRELEARDAIAMIDHDAFEPPVRRTTAHACTRVLSKEPPCIGASIPFRAPW